MQRPLIFISVYSAWEALGGLHRKPNKLGRKVWKPKKDNETQKRIHKPAGTIEVNEQMMKLIDESNQNENER